MNNFFNLSREQQIEVITQTANKTRSFSQIIEKDLWVTTILQIIFSLPFADKLVFKGGTSLSKVWNVVERFSEDIDLAVDRELFGLYGDLTINQIKKLRKQSSLFVKETLCEELKKAIEIFGIQKQCTVEAEPDGEGNKTYPEPRKIFIRYQSLFDGMTYLSSEIVLEIGARSLIEPTDLQPIKSLISDNLNIDTTLINSKIITAVPEKTFLEKAFLLHEIFTGKGNMTAERKSRHLYDLEKMMDMDFVVKAISNNELWNAIHHHREVFTRISDVDYTPDIRQRICLIPPQFILNDWKQDYETMQQTIIYGDSPSFEKLLKRMVELQEKFYYSSNLNK
jgi:predicted nucleotidyltransferase component of viral defense system